MNVTWSININKVYKFLYFIKIHSANAVTFCVRRERHKGDNMSSTVTAHETTIMNPLKGRKYNTTEAFS